MTSKRCPATGRAAAGKPSMSAYGMRRTGFTSEAKAPRPLPKTMATGCSMLARHAFTTFSSTTTIPSLARARAQTPCPLTSLPE